MTRASERAWDGDSGRVLGRGDAAGGGVMQEIKVFFFGRIRVNVVV